MQIDLLATGHLHSVRPIPEAGARWTLVVNPQFRLRSTGSRGWAHLSKSGVLLCAAPANHLSCEYSAS